jgi:hypothetical protein
MPPKPANKRKRANTSALQNYDDETPKIPPGDLQASQNHNAQNLLLDLSNSDSETDHPLTTGTGTGEAQQKAKHVEITRRILDKKKINAKNAYDYELVDVTELPWYHN